MLTYSLSEDATVAIRTLLSGVRNDLLNPANAQIFDMKHGDDPYNRDKNNQSILNSIGRDAGVYAIWVKDSMDMSLRYIGHTAGATARQRIRNHFINKDPRTASQLEHVNEELEKGSKVGVTFIAINPPELRLLIEELLVNELTDPRCWNKKSRKKRAA